MVLVSENKLSGLAQVRDLINLSSSVQITKINELQIQQIQIGA